MTGFNNSYSIYLYASLMPARCPLEAQSRTWYFTKTALGLDTSSRRPSQSALTSKPVLCEFVWVSNTGTLAVTRSVNFDGRSQHRRLLSPPRLFVSITPFSFCLRLQLMWSSLCLSPCTTVYSFPTSLALCVVVLLPKLVPGWASFRLPGIPIDG